MRLEAFDYTLPPERIAQQPLPERDASRLLRLDRASGTIEDRAFRDLPKLLRAGDLLVANDTRVLPMRLYCRRGGRRAQPRPGPGNRARQGFLEGEVEVLLLREAEAGVWDCLARPGRKLPVGEQLHFGEGLEAEIVSRGERGVRRLRFRWSGDFAAQLERWGHVPLPPYIDRPRGAPDAPVDRERYQTVYAREGGSAAAPTAGLHFTPGVMAELAERGVLWCTVTLHVGLGTFQPVQEQEIERHAMHAEPFVLGAEAAVALNAARRDGRRIIAVGTTAARTLEAAAPPPGGRFAPCAGETRLFLYPGGRPFQVTQGLITNFHAPRSTLLMLVAAFAGLEPVRAAYAHALANGYRFLSYGDCMLIA